MKFPDTVRASSAPSMQSCSLLTRLGLSIKRVCVAVIWDASFFSRSKQHPDEGGSAPLPFWHNLFESCEKDFTGVPTLCVNQVEQLSGHWYTELYPVPVHSGIPPTRAPPGPAVDPELFPEVQLSHCCTVHAVSLSVVSAQAPGQTCFFWTSAASGIPTCQMSSCSYFSFQVSFGCTCT